MTTLSRSITNGFGREIGRSAARTVINPILKGRDGNYVNINKGGGQAQAKQNAKTQFTVMEDNKIAVGKHITLSNVIFSFIGGLILMVVFFPAAIAKFFKMSKKLRTPMLVHQLDRPYYKQDRRYSSGVRPDEKAEIISTETYVQSYEKFSKLFSITGWAIIGVFVIIGLAVAISM